MEVKRYEYACLKRSRREIRLVTLSPGSPDELLVCTTYIVSLDDQPQYEALSYTWGDPDVTHPIFLDGVEFGVTTNLLTALKQLRSVHAARVLWIDAICINQSDNDEKSWQVAMMGDIYKSCSHGLMWLGEETDNTDAWCENEDGKCGREGGIRLPGMSYPSEMETYRCKWHGLRPRLSKGLELLEHLAQNKHLDEIPTMVRYLEAGNDDEPDFGEPIQAVGALCRRTWWNRMWTIQEVILPVELTLICGSLHCKWSAFVRAADNLSAHGASCCKIAWQQVKQRLPPWSHGHITLQGLASVISLVAMIESQREDVYFHRQERPYFLVYQAFSFRRSTDPRDRLYALLGLYPAESRPFEADYQIDMTELNKIANFKLISSPTTPLHGLCRAVPQYAPMTIPSWMQDFITQPIDVERGIDDDRRKSWAMYDCSSLKHPNMDHGVPQVCSDEFLSVIGINIGKPVIIGPVADTSPDEVMLNSIRKYSEILHLEEIAQEPYATNDGTTVEDAFFRTLLGDVCEGPDWVPRQVTDADIQKLKARVFPAADQAPACELEDPVLPITLGQQLYERRIFITDTYFIGMGPRNMLLSDQIWILFGSHLPFVLRQLPQDNDQSKERRIPYYSVLEVCYVHGVMYGEALGNGIDEQLIFLK